MRVLFLTLYPETAASPRYRVIQFLDHLRQKGIEYTVACALTPEEYGGLTGPQRQGRAFWYHATETPRRLRQLWSARDYDVVFVQKAIMTAYVRGALPLLRNCAKKIVYDFDDAVHLAPPHPLRMPWRIFEDRAQVFALIRSAQLVLAGNDWLATAARRENARTEMFPTVVDTDRFAPAQEQDTEFVVGWIGSPSTTPSLEPAAKALTAMTDGTVRLVGATPDTPLPFKADVRPWMLESEVTEVQRFSVGIMPLLKTEWTRGKCGLKALQYMACGVPCVATPFGVAQEIIQHGENGLFADSTEEWTDALEKLRDPALRKRLGDAGRATVESRYSLRHAGPRFAELLENLA